MTTSELGQRLIRLEQSLRDLETLQHQVHEEALALSQIVTEGGGGDDRTAGSRDDSASRVSSIPEAARQLGISVSMVHKLLRERRLGHLKVGARTLITAEHLEEFLAGIAVAARVTDSTQPAHYLGRAGRRSGASAGAIIGGDASSDLGGIRRASQDGAA